MLAPLGVHVHSVRRIADRTSVVFVPEGVDADRDLCPALRPEVDREIVRRIEARSVGGEGPPSDAVEVVGQKRETERISSTFMILLIAISIGMVINCSTSCGAKVGDTVTICT